jgi:hypothetical protein
MESLVIVDIKRRGKKDGKLFPLSCLYF